MILQNMKYFLISGFTLYYIQTETKIKVETVEKRTFQSLIMRPNANTYKS